MAYERSLAEKIGDFGHILAGNNAAMAQRTNERILSEQQKEEKREKELLRRQNIPKERQKMNAQDYRGVNDFLKGGSLDQAVTLLNNRMVKGSMFGMDLTETESLLQDITELEAIKKQGGEGWNETYNQGIGNITQRLDTWDDYAVGQKLIDPKAKRPAPLSDLGQIGHDEELGYITAEQAAASSVGGAEVQSIDNIGVGGLRVINFKDGTDALIGGDGNKIENPEARAKAITDALVGAVNQRGEIAQTESSSKAVADRISSSFEQVGQIRANNSILDEVSAALDGGAKSGIIDRTFPAWNSATATLRNAGQRLGLGVISSATFGALSEAEMKMAMTTALPTDMDEPELRQWIIDRKAAQNKIASQLESYIIFSEQGGSAGEWLQNQKGIYRQRQIDTRFGGVDNAEIQEALDYEEENGIRY